MEAQLSEANTFPSQSYTQSFFTRLPTDNRFLQSASIRVPPSASIDSNTLTFVLEKLEAANVYVIQETYLKIRFKITTASGALPDTAKKVAPRNNVLHTLWESCRIFINDVLLTTNARDYNYKSYISTAISYSLGAKSTHLQSSGWYSDSAGMFNDVTANNAGFEERHKLFRIDNDTSKGYQPDGAEFYGRIFHDLIACETGLPPNTKVKIELDRAPDSFVLQSDDTEKYKVKLLDAHLYVPVAQLTVSVFHELSNYMAKTGDGTFRNDVAIHYRRLEIRALSIPNGNRDYYTKSLLSDSDNPCKLIICFVEAKAKAGSYANNPFEFRRSWEVAASGFEVANTDNGSISEKLSELEDRVQNRLSSLISAQFDDLATKILQSTQKLLEETLKGKQTQQPEVRGSKEAEADEATQRLEGFIASTETVKDLNNQMEDNLDTSPATRNLRPRKPPGSSGALPLDEGSSIRSASRASEYFSTDPAPPPAPSTKKTQFIQSISCTLNSTPIDQVCLTFSNFID